MTNLFMGKPIGRIIIPTLQDALDKIEQLEKRVNKLERNAGK